MEPKTYSLAEVIELPFGLAGKIYRSPMPFRGRDRHGELFERFQDLDVSVIVLLAEETECTGVSYRGDQFRYADTHHAATNYGIFETEFFSEASFQHLFAPCTLDSDNR